LRNDPGERSGNSVSDARRLIRRPIRHCNIEQQSVRVIRHDNVIGELGGSFDES
jgi:hypothetical protein